MDKYVDKLVDKFVRNGIGVSRAYYKKKQKKSYNDIRCRQLRQLIAVLPSTIRLITRSP